MNEQAFFDRLVIFSFDNQDCMGTNNEVIILIPEYTSVEDFRDSYNKIVQKIECENAGVNKKLEENREKCRLISNFLHKYHQKENIKKEAQVKIDENKNELDVLLKLFLEIRKDFVDIDNEFKNIIKSIGGVVLEDKITNFLTNHNNSSMSSMITHSVT